ncbi:phosphoenolpyruvate hydrolase family protein [Rhizobium mongolense]|uniref:Putative TIM-barrel enzyme/transcriptional regulator with AAA-type ATPase domain n=1 Tax=Rhizobium mongolense TaxID=57676 RepID=A0A7W6WGX2_9HYPH|nr:phosphoenolpyruvate hydrolase family protein [Rhizobium mongolense]MBB4277686.1 putative TIM-barrel enzyme/transcriptional regulator with AAA-type ATPase domain [Rhizobium mongolense]
MADPIAHPTDPQSLISAPAHARAEIVATLMATRGKPNSTLVGAAIGTGMAAQAACRGGADFILALNAGRLRSMGAPSIFSLLALRNSNDFVLDFAQSEILPLAKVPVFFGGSAFDPRCSIETELERIAEAGFGAIANFPTAIFLDGRFRTDIERAGLGFQRELDMLRAAQKRGMATLAYVRTAAEAQQAAHAGVDIINLNLGWNVGGTVGSRSGLSLAQAAEYAKIVFRQIRGISEETLCLLEGGPIVSPDQMYEVSAVSKADGYIGGSTIDRVPLEASMEQITSAFKSVGTLQKRIDELERQLEHVQREYAIVGRSPAIQQIKQRIEKLAASPLAVLITGELGTGKKLLARAIHEAARRPGSKLISASTADSSGESLFGSAPSEGGRRMLGLLAYQPKATLLIENVECLCVDAQERLIEVIETGVYRRLGDNDRGRFEGRLILTSARPLTELGSGGQIIASLESRLSPGHVFLPNLRDRLEDLPLLAEHFLQELRKDRRSRKLSVDHSAYRVLMTYGWPENIRELRSVLETAAIRCEGDWIKAEHLPPLGGADAPQPHPADEREWILNALQRHRFRRGETARYLGISRKTLYNKMRAYSFPLQTRGEDFE